MTDTFGKNKVQRVEAVDGPRHKYYIDSTVYMRSDLLRSALTPEDGGFVPHHWDNGLIAPAADAAGYFILYYNFDGTASLTASGQPLMYRVRRATGERRYTQPSREQIGDAVDLPYMPPNRNRAGALLRKMGWNAIGIGGKDRWHVQGTHTLLPDIVRCLVGVAEVRLWPDGDWRLPHIRGAWAEFASALRRAGVEVALGCVPADSKLDDEYARVGGGAAGAEHVMRLPVVSAWELGPGIKDYRDWGVLLRVNKDGVPSVNVCAASCNKLFENSPPLRGRVKYNVRTMLAEWHTDDGIKILDDAGLLRLGYWLCEWTCIGEWKPDHVKGAVIAWSMQNLYDPIAKWLGALQWDKTDRFGRLGVAMGGTLPVKAGDIMKMMMAGSVGRVRKPGGQMDACVILVGEAEGEGKSTFWPTLFGREYVVEVYGIRDDKDLKMMMARSWCQVFEELDVFGKKTEELMKALITARVEEYRPPYGASFITQPRRNVLVGNTNSKEFLRMEGEHRRYYPIRVKGKIDNEWVAANREQLWAQAMWEYCNNPYWWDVEVDRTDYRMGVEENDRIAAMIEHQVANGCMPKHNSKDVIRGADLYAEVTALGMRVTPKALGAILKRLGWEHTQVKGSALVWPPNHVTPRIPFSDGPNWVYRNSK